MQESPCYLLIDEILNDGIFLFAMYTPDKMIRRLKASSQPTFSPYMMPQKMETMGMQ